MVACVFAANQISKKLQFGYAGNPFVDQLSPAMARRLGGTLEEVISALGNLTQLYDEAKLFAKL
jgi:hypothetical protein